MKITDQNAEATRAELAILRQQLRSTTDMLEKAAQYVTSAWHEGALQHCTPKGNTAAARMFALVKKNEKILAGEFPAEETRCPG